MLLFWCRLRGRPRGTRPAMTSGWSWAANTAGSATSSVVVPGFCGRRRGRGSSRVSGGVKTLACDK